jgi:hypothetical protein
MRFRLQRLVQPPFPTLTEESVIYNHIDGIVRQKLDGIVSIQNHQVNIWNESRTNHPSLKTDQLEVYHGTGFALAPNIVVTCHHVIAEHLEAQEFTHFKRQAITVNGMMANVIHSWSSEPWEQDIAFLETEYPITDNPFTLTRKDLERYRVLYLIENADHIKVGLLNLAICSCSECGDHFETHNRNDSHVRFGFH